MKSEAVALRTASPILDRRDVIRHFNAMAQSARDDILQRDQDQRRAMPDFRLYGIDAVEPWLDIVHYERIPFRAGPFDFSIDPHFHSTLLQVLYVTRGEGTASIDGKEWKIAAPCLVVVPSRSVHGFWFRDDVDGHVITLAQVALESVVEAAAPDLLASIRTPAVLAVEPESRRGTPLEHLFEAIGREATGHGRWQFAAGLALVVNLFVQISRLSEKARLSVTPARSARAAKIERFRALLDEWCRTRRPVAEYADAMGVTTGQLTRLSHEAFGISAIRAIDARAIHEAKRLLQYSSLSVKQIAQQLGFEDEAYFGRFFRKNTGFRPTEFRLGAQGRYSPSAPQG